MEVDKLKLIEVIGNQVVQLAFVVLLSYVAKLAAAYLHYRLDITGEGVFVRKSEENKQ